MNAPRHPGRRRARIALVAAMTTAMGVACAARQRVPLDCVPEQVTVYVDQEALDGVPEALVLRSDRPHKIFLKGPGYEPQLIVLEPQLDERGRKALQPKQICVELVPVGVDRRLELEIEEDDGASAAEPNPGGAKP